MLQSSMKDYELDAFTTFDFVLIDNVTISSRYFVKALQKLSCKYHIDYNSSKKR